jgi:hypothetical protein
MKILLAIDRSTYSDAAVEEVVRKPWPGDSEVKIISAIFRTWWTTCPPT